MDTNPLANKNSDSVAPKAPHNLFKADPFEDFFSNKAKTFIAFIAFKNYLFRKSNH